jgi:hypothetical protein
MIFHDLIPSRSWYLADDTQLFLLIPILAQVHAANRKAAWALVLGLIVGCLAMRAWFDSRICGDDSSLMGGYVVVRA